VFTDHFDLLLGASIGFRLNFDRLPFARRSPLSSLTRFKFHSVIKMQLHSENALHHVTGAAPSHRCSPLSALPVRTLSRGQRVHVQHAGRQLIGQVLQHEPHTDMVSLLLQLNPASNTLADDSSLSLNFRFSATATSDLAPQLPAMTHLTASNRRRVSLSQPLFLHVKRPFAELRLVDPNSIPSASVALTSIALPNGKPFGKQNKNTTVGCQFKSFSKTATTSIAPQCKTSAPLTNTECTNKSSATNVTLQSTEIEHDADSLTCFDPNIASPLQTDIHLPNESCASPSNSSIAIAFSSSCSSSCSSSSAFAAHPTDQ
jgi:hypothetical protein